MTKIRRGRITRIGAAVLGSAMLLGVGVSAATAEDGAIDVGVDIEALPEGSLGLTIDPEAQVGLTESDSTGDERQFVGSLPEVTVTDTRTAEDVPDGAYWYVVGAIDDFVGDAGQPDIVAADSFGWSPRLVSGDESLAAPGDEVAPGEGFSEFELLASTWNSAEAGPGTWTAAADLTLRTPATVEPGSYSSSLTLSLYED